MGRCIRPLWPVINVITKGFWNRAFATAAAANDVAIRIITVGLRWPRIQLHRFDAVFGRGVSVMVSARKICFKFQIAHGGILVIHLICQRNTRHRAVALGQALAGGAEHQGHVGVANRREAEELGQVALARCAWSVTLLD